MLEEIRARRAAATPTPWDWSDYCLGHDTGPNEWDMEFIRHAPDDVQWLLGEVDRLSQEVIDLRRHLLAQTWERLRLRGDDLGEPAVLRGSGRYEVEFRAVGRMSWRVARELPDGRMAYLEFPTSHEDVSPQHYLQGARTRNKLARAVAAARDWRDRYRRLRMAARPWLSIMSGAAAGVGIMASWLANKDRG